jgi:uncharacterized delta-60 repeat protein
MPKPNAVKYSTATQSETLRIGNFHIGVTNKDYGPTINTGYYAGIVSLSGYTGYVWDGSKIVYNQSSSDSDLVNFLSQRAGASFSGLTAALAWSLTQSDILVVNKNYENIVTDGLILNLDAGFISSYPRTGNIFYDLSGRNNHGALINGPTFNSNIGGSISLDGVDDTISVPKDLNGFEHNIQYDIDWTIECWMYMYPHDDLPQNYIGIYGNYNGCNYNSYKGNAQGILIFYPSQPNLTFINLGFGPSNNPTGSQCPSVSINWSGSEVLWVNNNVNKWCHFAMTSEDGTFYRIYVNGVQQGTTKTVDFKNSQNRIDNNLTSTSTYRWGGSGTTAFNQVDFSNMRIYNRSLSQKEVLQNYYANLQKIIPKSGLMLSFDAQNRSALDTSGNSNNGTLVNGATFSGLGSGSWLFDGVDDRIDFTQIDQSNWSVSAFINMNFTKIRSSRSFVLTNNTLGLRNGRNILELTYSISIMSIATDANGNIFIGGRICEYAGVERELILKLDSSGNIISDFDLGIKISQTQDVTDIAVSSDGSSLYYVGYNIGTLRRVNSTSGQQTQTISSVTNGGISQANLVIDEANNKAYIGGWFTAIQGVSTQRIARLNLSTMTVDSSFDVTTGFANTEDVQMMVLQPDGKLIVGGQFTSYKGNAYNRIIRLNSDASIDNTFSIGTGFNGTVLRKCISLQSDGKVIIGGDFTTYNGVSANRIVRLNSDGTRDTSFNIGTGFNSSVRALSLQSDGKVIVGGDFTTYNGFSVGRIIRLNSDGTRDTSFNTSNASFNSSVTSIHIQSDGKILIGGQFSEYSNTVRMNLIRLDSDGTIDQSFRSDTGLFGAYRFNTQFSYTNSSNSLTTHVFFRVTRPINHDWCNFQTAYSVLSGFNNYTITKNSSNLYTTYWNSILSSTASYPTAISTSLVTNTTGIPRGNISEISIYNRDLSQEEVSIIFNSSRLRYGL